MMLFSERLAVQRGVTAIIGAGGKTTLLLRLAEELSRCGTVIVTTTTHIFPPQNMPFSETAAQPKPVLCVGTPCEHGKLTAPREPIGVLARYADYVLVEADGAKRLPIKAHAAYEPVIPAEAEQVICVVGASGLNGGVMEKVHRPEVIAALTGEAACATPEAVARLLQRERLHTRLLINQVDTPAREQAARELAGLLDGPCVLAALEKGEIICSF